MKAELPARIRGARSVFVKFWGQNANALFDLFVTADLEARSALPLLSLRKGENEFVFKDPATSAPRALVGWSGTGVRLLGRTKKLEYPTGKPRVVVNDDAVSVLFPEKVGVWLAREHGLVRGTRRLTVGQGATLAPLSHRGSAPLESVIAAGNIEPVIDWAAYLREHQAKFGKARDFPGRGGLRIEKVSLEGELLEWAREGDRVRVTLKLRSGGRVDWFFAPAEERLGGGTYRGVKWKLRLTGLNRVHEITVEEPAAFTVGDWRLAQVHGLFDEHQVGLSGEFYMPERGYFARRQPFFFLAGGAGSTVSYFNEAAYAVARETCNVDRIVLRTRSPVRAAKVIETPEKFWLFRAGDFSSKWDAVNEWTSVYDSMAEHYRAMKGIAAVEPKPTLLWQFAWNAKVWGRDYVAAARAGLPPKERWFYRLADEIPKLARWGVRVIYVSGRWKAMRINRRTTGWKGATARAPRAHPDG